MDIRASDWPWPLVDIFLSTKTRTLLVSSKNEPIVSQEFWEGT